MYINLLTKIKNAQAAGKDNLRTPFSKMDLAVAEVLVRFGYLSSVEVKGKSEKRTMEINLNKEKIIRGLKFISLPSRRVYVGYREIKPVKSGYGLAIISTPKGIMTNQEARKQKLGGQILLEIW